MEESSNGKLEEIQKVESQGEDKTVVVEESGEFKAEAESVREIVFNGNSESANGDGDGDDSSSHSSSSDEEAETVEKNPQVVDSGELEEEKTVIDSVVDPTEPEVSLAEELIEDVEVAVEIDDVAESESKEIEVNISQSLEESNGVSADETNDMSKAIEEETLPYSDENNGISQVVTEVVSETIREIILPSSEENGEVAPADVVSKAILEQNAEESSSTVDLESKGKVDEPNQTMANVGRVDDTSNPRELTDKPETIPGSTGNPPIISLTQRNFRPTSWRSCCGLLDVLRRSDR